jgi:prepilin-type N-terminal cleavage/methylation domain-containing protein
MFSTVNSSPYTEARRRGFTLIEVLASMAVLVVIMLAVMRIFNDTKNTMMRGNNIVLRQGAARAALEVITRDLEGLVVDRRLAFYKEAQTVDNNFDEIWLITRNGSPNDGRDVQQIRYVVTQDTSRGYLTYILNRYTRDFDVATAAGVDPYVSADKEWWKKTSNGFDPSAKLLDNVVRFDVYVCDEDGHLIQSGGSPVFGGIAPYSTAVDSTVAGWPEPFLSSPQNYPADRPPAYFDIYLQVTSDSAMKRGAALLSQSTASLRRQGYSLLYQDSNVLMKRIVPKASAVERLHPNLY